jgi:hypothetical protein
LQQRLSWAGQNKLTEALPLALAVAGRDADYAGATPAARAAAVLLVGLVGNREHTAVLERLLEDQTMCARVAVAARPQQALTTVSVQIRDVALVALLQLTEQRPADYGYAFAQRSPDQIYVLSTLFVKTEPERAAALAKWRAWKQAQLPDGTDK